jgi:hypothetical protein
LPDVDRTRVPVPAFRDSYTRRRDGRDGRLLARMVPVRWTEVVQRVRVLVLVALLAVAGCGSRGQGTAPAAPAPATSAGSASPAGSQPASPTGSPTPSSLIEFTVDGAGPYQLGAMLSALRSVPGLEEIKAGGRTCPQNTTARGIGGWRDVQLSFRGDGVLYLAVNRSPSIPTPSGAWLGTTLAQLKTIYAKVTAEELVRSTRRAYLVATLSGRGILFDLDAKTRVTAMRAADTTYLRDSFKDGTAFC